MLIESLYYFNNQLIVNSRASFEKSPKRQDRSFDLQARFSDHLIVFCEDYFAPPSARVTYTHTRANLTALWIFRGTILSSNFHRAFTKRPLFDPDKFIHDILREEFVGGVWARAKNCCLEWSENA